MGRGHVHRMRIYQSGLGSPRRRPNTLGLRWRLGAPTISQAARSIRLQPLPEACPSPVFWYPWMPVISLPGYSGTVGASIALAAVSSMPAGAVSY
jgi:hypothetical protein